MQLLVSEDDCFLWLSLVLVYGALYRRKNPSGTLFARNFPRGYCVMGSRVQRYDASDSPNTTKSH